MPETSLDRHLGACYRWPFTLDSAGFALGPALARHEDDEAKRMLPLFILGEVFRRTGRISEMESTLRRCLAHADRSTSTRYQLGARRMLATALEVGRTRVTQCIDECGAAAGVAR